MGCRDHYLSIKTRSFCRELRLNSFTATSSRDFEIGNGWQKVSPSREKKDRPTPRQCPYVIDGRVPLNFIKAFALGVRHDIYRLGQKESETDDRHYRVISQIPNLYFGTEVHSHGLGLSLGSARSEDSAAAPHPFPKFLLFLRGHLRPALHHSPTPVHGWTTAPPETSEQDSAENQKAQSLPETDPMQRKEWRHEPVPQAHQHKTQHRRSEQHKQQKFRSPEYPSSLHICPHVL